MTGVTAMDDVVTVTQADWDAAKDTVLRVIYGPVLDRASAVSIPGVVAFDHAVEAAARHRLATEARTTPAQDVVAFQTGVDAWMDACFGDKIKADQLERADRFCEEALELCQTMQGFTADRAHALVDYVFGRPVGDRHQEVGGVMVTLAALCNTVGLSVNEEADRELDRVWTKVDAIRAKQAAKPTGSALPVAALSQGRDGLVEAADADGVAEALAKACAPYAKNKGTSGLTPWCDAHGVKKSHAYEFANGKRLPCNDLLKALGFTRAYVPDAALKDAQA